MGNEATQTGHIRTLPSLPKDWRWMRLDDLIDDERGICYGIVQPGENDPDGIPMVNTQDVLNGVVNERIGFKVARKLHDRFRRSQIRGGEVLVTLVGAYFGRVAVAPEAYKGFNCSRAVGVVPVKENAQFVSYALRSPLAQHFMQSWANTTAQPTLNLKEVATLPVPLPPPSEQRAIASVLGSLDDKIELNRRMNETLEALAQSLFKSWFVDATQSALPKGWRAGKISDICTTQYGFTASAAEEPVGPKFLRVMDINKRNWIDWGAVPHCPISDEDKSRYALSVGDIVVARMADPGKSAIVEQPIDAVFASYLVRLKTESLAQAYYLYHFLKSQAYTEYSQGAMSGSVQANMNAKVIVDAALPVPPVPLMEAFLEKVLPLRQRIVANVEESRTLAALRDALLPKLLSGELRMKEAYA